MITEISDKQRELATSWLHGYKRVIATGAIRTGKSMMLGYSFADDMVNKLLHDDKVIFSNRYFILGYSQDNVYNNVWIYVEERLKFWGFVTMPHTKGKRMIRGNHELIIEFYGGNNASSFKTMQTAGTFRGGLIDEAALLNKEIVDTAEGRTITFDNVTIFHTTNPEGSNLHWYYTDYICNAESKVVHFEMSDNPLIPISRINDLKHTFTKTMYERKVLGLWVLSDGACYPNKPKVDNININDYDIDIIYVGIDEGNNDATTAIFTIVTKSDEFIVFKQYYHKNGEDQKTIIDTSNDILKLLRELSGKYKNIKIQVNSETNPGNMFQILKQYEYSPTLSNNVNILPDNVFITKVNKKKEDHKSKSAIQERIDATNILINVKKLIIDKSCKNLIYAFDGAVYKSNVRLDNGTSDIDSLDAFEYSIKPEIKYIMKEMIGVI